MELQENPEYYEYEFNKWISILINKINTRKIK